MKQGSGKQKGSDRGFGSYQKKRKGFLSALRALFDLAYALLATIAFLIFLIPFIIFRVRRVVQWTARLWARTLFRGLGLKLHVEGRENLQRTGPLILLANHQSYFDIPSLLLAIDRDIAWMAKASLFRIPLFGWAMSASGAIPVERGQARKARASLYRAAEQIRSGSPVLIFPEGTRGHPDGSLLPLKPGGFVLARLAGVPLQVVTLYGPNEVWPIKQPYRIPRFYRERTIRVAIHRAIPPEDYKDRSASELAALVARIMERPIDRFRAFNDTLDS